MTIFEKKESGFRGLDEGLRVVTYHVGDEERRYYFDADGFCVRVVVLSPFPSPE